MYAIRLVLNYIEAVVVLMMYFRYFIASFNIGERVLMFRVVQLMGTEEFSQVRKYDTAHSGDAGLSGIFPLRCF